MRTKKPKSPKNRYVRSGKYSEYKTLQLVECFARDMPIRHAARLTKMTERTVRDRYADIREKLLVWSLDYPDRFNGFGHLLMDPDGTININLLEMLFHYSESQGFRERMAKRYPRFRTERDAALAHVVEASVRRIASVELPEVTEDFLTFVQSIFAASKSESFLQSVRHQLPGSKARRLYWQNAQRRMNSQSEFRARRFPKSDGERFYRDLKYCLSRDPI